MEQAQILQKIEVKIEEIIRHAAYYYPTTYLNTRYCLDNR